ncbi:MAG: T9SS type A sorting domain-containing protein [candidate division KSB1 bacterium]|nr:T9SS type A sorting domain-containing protein [candidate division KSB1 bacterium]
MKSTSKSPPRSWRKTRKGPGAMGAMVMALATALILQHDAAAQYQVAQSVVGSGGGAIGNASYRVVSTVGQPAIGVLSGVSHINGVGFWYASGGLITRVEQAAETLPREYRLEQNYPNPFNPATTICFALPKRSAVSLVLVDVLGREVATLVDKELEPGEYKVVFNAEGLSTGVYFYRLEAKGLSADAGKGFSQTKRLLVLK